MCRLYQSSPQAALLAALLFVFAWAQQAAAAQLTKTFTITAEELDNASADFFDLTLAIGGARVTIVPSDNSNIVLQASVTYDDFGPEPEMKITSDNSVYTAMVSSGYVSSYAANYFPFPQKWNVLIGSYDVMTSLTVAGGGVDASMDFGGMPLKTINLALGGVSAFIDFSKPTTHRVQSFMVDGGGIDLTLDNIANTDFQRFSFTGGGLLANLDFRGAYASPDHSIRIIGAGSSIDISVPEEAGETLEAISMGGFTLVRGKGWRRFPNFWFYKDFVTTNYHDAEVILDMEVITAGAVVIIRRN